MFSFKYVGTVEHKSEGIDLRKKVEELEKKFSELTIKLNISLLDHNATNRSPENNEIKERSNENGKSFTSLFFFFPILINNVIPDINHTSNGSINFHRNR